MGVDELEPFEAFLITRGYKRETNRMVVDPAHDEWWKAFGRVGEDRHYTIALRVYDHTPHMGEHQFKHRYGVAFVMKVNHRSPVDVEDLRLEMVAEGMTVEGFEERCAELHRVMWDMWPKLN